MFNDAEKDLIIAAITADTRPFLRDDPGNSGFDKSWGANRINVLVAMRGHPNGETIEGNPLTSETLMRALRSAPTQFRNSVTDKEDELFIAHCLGYSREYPLPDDFVTDILSMYGPATPVGSAIRTGLSRPRRWIEVVLNQNGATINREEMEEVRKRAVGV